jgi:hypothetical protein
LSSRKKVAKHIENPAGEVTVHHDECDRYHNHASRTHKWRALCLRVRSEIWGATVLGCHPYDLAHAHAAIGTMLNKQLNRNLRRAVVLEKVI